VRKNWTDFPCYKQERNTSISFPGNMPKKSKKANKKKWIAKAVKHPGRITQICKRKGYKSATVKCARDIIRSKRSSVSLKRAAALSLRFEKRLKK